MRMFRNTRENKVNESTKSRSTWDVISVTGRTDTRSSESSYLNKRLNSKTADISNDVDERFSKIKTKRKKVQNHIAQLREEREKKIAEKNKIENDLDYIEKIAREKYKMVKPGERIFKVIEN